MINIFVLSFFANFQFFKLINLFYYLTICIIIFSSLGAVVGFLSFTYDIQSSISNFFIIPITFLSGTFFSIEAIDKNFHFFFKLNPFYYLVNGFRSSFISGYEINIFNDICILIILLISLLLSIFIFKKGYKVIN